MRYCKKCVMSDTRPGISFNEEGVCSACQAYEARKTIDWDKRYKESEQLCDKTEKDWKLKRPLWDKEEA